MNGVRVTGQVNEADDGALQVFTYKDLMPPESVEALEAVEEDGELELSISFPIFQHEKAIKVGFLTAAYLLWFKELGYSWVLQSHLNTVREQILRPDEEILSGFLLDIGEHSFGRPWIGFLEFEELVYPCVGIVDRLVVLPSFDAPLFSDVAATLGLASITTEYEAVRICDWHQFPDPTGILYRDRLVIFPDLFSRRNARARVLQYIGDGSPPRVLYQVD